MIYEYDFLNTNQLRQIVSLFDAGKFVDGARSGPKDKDLKDNTQQDDYELNKMANTAIHKLLQDSKVSDLHPLNRASPILMLKYEEGQHYNDHVDYWNMHGLRTDYTAVITLNDDYEGGEHFIKIGPETIEKRLDPGKLMIYQTDYIHGVRPVISGVRKCVTFWIESSIPDPTMRYYITELNKLYEKFPLTADKETVMLLDHVRCGITKRCIQMR